MEWDVQSTVGLVRDINEDSWAFATLEEGLYLAVVADGMGGYDGGEVASSLAVECLRSFVEKNVGEMSSEKLLKDAVKSCNGRVFKEARSKRELSSMGTTLTAALVSESKGEIHIAHIGDSRAYLIRNGYIRQITDDHSVTGDLVRRGSITEEDALRHPARNILTMALGTSQEVRCSLYREKIFPEDIILLCTDGLTGLMVGKEILSLVLDSPQKGLASNLTERANSLGGPDNTTVLVLWPYGGCRE